MKRNTSTNNPEASMNIKKHQNQNATGRKSVQVNSNALESGNLSNARPDEHVKTEIVLIQDELIFPEYHKSDISRRIKKVKMIKNKHCTFGTLPAVTLFDEPPPNFSFDASERSVDMATHHFLPEWFKKQNDSKYKNYSTVTTNTDGPSECLKSNGFELDAEEMPTFSSASKSQTFQEPFLQRKYLRSSKNYKAEIEFPDDLLDPVEFAIDSPEPSDYLQMSNKSGLPTPLIQKPKKSYLKEFYIAERIPPKLNQRSRSLIANESSPFAEYRESTYATETLEDRKMRKLEKYIRDEATKILPRFENMEPVSEFSFSRIKLGDNSSLDPLKDNKSLIDDESCLLMDSSEDILELIKLEKYIKKEGSKILSRFEHIQPESEFSYSQRKLKNNLLTDSERISQENFSLLTRSFGTVNSEKVPDEMKFQLSEINKKISSLREKRFLLMQEVSLGSDNDKDPTQNTPVLSHSGEEAKVKDYLKWPYSSVKRFNDELFPPSPREEDNIESSPIEYESINLVNDSMGCQNATVNKTQLVECQTQTGDQNFAHSFDNDISTPRKYNLSERKKNSLAPLEIEKKFSSRRYFDDSSKFNGSEIKSGIKDRTGPGFKISTSRNKTPSSPYAIDNLSKVRFPNEKDTQCEDIAYSSQSQSTKRLISDVEIKARPSTSIGQSLPTDYNRLLENISDVNLSDISVYETPNIDMETMSLVNNDTLSTDPALTRSEVQDEIRKYINSRVLNKYFPHSEIMDESPPAMVSLPNSHHTSQSFSDTERQDLRFGSSDSRNIINESPPSFSTSLNTVVGFSPNHLSTSTPQRERQLLRSHSNAGIQVNSSDLALLRKGSKRSNSSILIIDETPPLFLESQSTIEGLSPKTTSATPKSIRKSIIRFQDLDVSNLTNSLNDHNMIDQNPRAVQFPSFQSVDYGKHEMIDSVSEITLTESLNSLRSRNMSVSKIDDYLISSESDSSASSSGNVENSAYKKEVMLIRGPKTKKWKFGMQLSGFKSPLNSTDFLLSSTKNFAQLQKFLNILSEESLNNVAVNLDKSKQKPGKAETQLNVQNQNNMGCPREKSNLNLTQDPKSKPGTSRASKLSSAFTSSARNKKK